MRINPAISLAACVLALGFAGTANAGQYSKAVQKACAADYKEHCGEYGLESEALRLCMDKAGQKLSKGCVNALVKDGQVSQAEVDRRKTSGH
jgi:hypothetical protein